MQTSSSNAANSVAPMRPSASQTGSQSSVNRPAASSHFGRPAPGSVSRSEAGVSVDLSAASNTAANGEDPMEILAHQQGSTTSGAAELSKPEIRAKSMEAEKWFQDANRNASTRGNVSFVDDDPPFHLPSNLPNDFPMMQRQQQQQQRQHQQQQPQSQHHLPVRTNPSLPMSSFPHLQSLQSSGSEEFRSVIDDLTVENKKLKKENRQLKRQHATHTHPDKLFEVRMHGLDSMEKKKLMQMLREFNDSLTHGRGQPAHQSKMKKGSKVGSNKPSSSSTLHSNSNNHVDSAYASGSTSGNASGSQPAESRTAVASDATPRSRRPDRDQNVRSYLMNMSKALLPKQPAVMTEAARKKLVVKRLEQLFTGKPNTGKKNSQIQQQQQVSTEAAIEHRQQTEAVGHTVPDEGSREAMIFPTDTDVSTLVHESSNLSNNATGDQSSGKPSPSTGRVPDQRPTRPLDLDVSRALNPAENMAYIRHLGFRNSGLQGAAAVQPGAEGPWVPLNLLMNLAQLHTVNVTPDLVREGIKEFSRKFEFSSDGSKLRWKGGLEGTRMSGESSSSANSKENSPTEGTHDIQGGRQSPSRSRSSKPSTSGQTPGAMKSNGGTYPSGTKTSSRDVSASTGPTSNTMPTNPKRPVFLGSMSRTDSFSYQPIFLHGAGSEEENDYFLDEDDSLMSSAMREDTTGSSSGQRSRRPVTTGKEEGAVIFYHRARFCTDLSGDHEIVPVNTTQYTRAGIGHVGASPKLGREESETRGLISASESTRRAASLDVIEGPPIRMEESPIQPVDARRVELTDPVSLFVTGIGNTIPSDNIALWPKYRQFVRKRTKPLLSSSRKFVRRRLLDPSLANRLPSCDKVDVILKPAGCVRRDLPPSELPSPGFLNQWSSSESADGWSDEGGDDETKSELDDNAEVAAILPALANTAFDSHSGEAEDSGAEQDDEADADEMEEDDDSDGEIDMLAYERQQNADEIERREREWEEQQQQANDPNFGMDEEEGKRSSAATVGDRSFLSDEDDMSPGHASAGAVAGQKREREEPVPPESSPAKRVESSRTRNGRK